MNAKLYSLKCLTNMHAGNGEANFSIIDNEVERDPVIDLPVINSSGVKGAFRQYFEQNYKANKNINPEEKPENTIVKLFGSPIKNSGKDQSTPGKLKFLTANLLGMPMRASAGSKAWYMVTTKDALLRFIELAQAVGIEKTADANLKSLLSANVVALKEDINYKTCADAIGVEGIEDLQQITDNNFADALSSLLGRETVILSAAKMRAVSLPVLARNQLENGESKNLWYEEIVPHESLFYCIVLSDASQDALTAFDEKVNGQVVQFGGNATIGYGLCQVKRLTATDCAVADGQ